MKPDMTLIVAVHRNQSGADIHTLNNLLQLYVSACHTENETVAYRAKRELTAAMIEREWNQAALVRE